MKKATPAKQKECKTEITVTASHKPGVRPLPLRSAASYEMDAFMAACDSDSETFANYLIANRTRYDLTALINQGSLKLAGQPLLIYLISKPNAVAFLHALLHLPSIDYSVVDKSRQTALHWAVIQDDMVLVDLLLTAITTPTILQMKNRAGLAPTELALILHNPNSYSIANKINQAIAGTHTSVPLASMLTAAEIAPSISNYEMTRSTPAEHYQLALKLAYYFHVHTQHDAAQFWFTRAAAEALQHYDFDFLLPQLGVGTPMQAAVVTIAESPVILAASSYTSDVIVLANSVLGFQFDKYAKKARQLATQLSVGSSHLIAEFFALAEPIEVTAIAHVPDTVALMLQGNPIILAKYHHLIHTLSASPTKTLLTRDTLTVLNNCRAVFSPAIQQAMDGIFADARVTSYYAAMHAAYGIGRAIDYTTALDTLRIFLTRQTSSTQPFTTLVLSYTDVLCGSLADEKSPTRIKSALAVIHHTAMKHTFEQTTHLFEFIRLVIECSAHLTQFENQFTLAQTLLNLYHRLQSVPNGIYFCNDILTAIRSFNLFTPRADRHTDTKLLATFAIRFADITPDEHEKISLLQMSADLFASVTIYMKLASCSQQRSASPEKVLTYYRLAIETATRAQDKNAVDAILESLHEYQQSLPTLTLDVRETVQAIFLLSLNLTTLAYRQRQKLIEIFDDANYSETNLLLVTTTLWALKNFDFRQWNVAGMASLTQRRMLVVFTNLLLQEKNHERVLASWLAISKTQVLPAFAQTYSQLLAPDQPLLTTANDVTLDNAAVALATISIRPQLNKEEGRMLKKLVRLHYLPAMIELASRYALMGRERRSLYLNAKLYIMLSGDQDGVRTQTGFSDAFIQQQKKLAQKFIETSQQHSWRFKTLAQHYLSLLNDCDTKPQTVSDSDAWLLQTAKAAVRNDILQGMIQATGQSSESQFEVMMTKKSYTVTPVTRAIKIAKTISAVEEKTSITTAPAFFTATDVKGMPSPSAPDFDLSAPTPSTAPSVAVSLPTSSRPMSSRHILQELTQQQPKQLSTPAQEISFSDVTASPAVKKEHPSAAKQSIDSTPGNRSTEVYHSLVQQAKKAKSVKTASTQLEERLRP